MIISYELYFKIKIVIWYNSGFVEKILHLIMNLNLLIYTLQQKFFIKITFRVKQRMKNFDESFIRNFQLVLTNLRKSRSCRSIFIQHVKTFQKTPLKCVRDLLPENQHPSSPNPPKSPAASSEKESKDCPPPEGSSSTHIVVAIDREEKMQDWFLFCLYSGKWGEMAEDLA